MRIRAVVILLGLLFAGFVVAPSSAAQDEHDDEPVVATQPPPAGSVSIDTQLAFTGATVSTPGESVPRSFDAYHTAVFVQSWLPFAFFAQNVTVQDPPPELPVHRVDITGTWGGVHAPGVSTQTVYYASDGTTAWLSYPQGQSVTEAPSAPPPPTGWFVAPPRVIEAFNGTATLEPTLGVVTPEGTPVAAEAPSSDSSTFVFWWVLLCVAAVAAVAGFFFVRRRRASSTEVAGST